MSDKSLFKNKSAAGKGDSPRNISKKFWDNWDEIEWDSGSSNNKKKSDKSKEKPKDKTE
jgi:hypothetical protein